MSNWLNFLAEWVRNPAQIGAIAPTTKYVAKKVIRHMPLNTSTIVEYGPGNGAVSFPVRERFPDADIILIEKSPRFAEQLRISKKFNVVEGDARNIADYVKFPDVILSALPFASFSDSMRNEILRITAKNMRADSSFIVYLQYSRLLENYLPNYFHNIKQDYEWKNIFPTNIYICSGPK